MPIERRAQWAFLPLLAFLWLIAGGDAPPARAGGGGGGRGADREADAEVFAVCGGYRLTGTRGEFQIESARIVDPGGKTVRTLELSRILETRCEDLNRDGVLELIFEDYTGGAHCCSTIHVYEMKGKTRNLLTFYAGNAIGIEWRDPDGDGVKEILSGDDGFAYFDDLSFADSPFLPLVLCYREGRYRDCTIRYRGLMKKEFEESRRDVSSRSGALRFIGLSMLDGKEKEGWEYLREKAPRETFEWLRARKTEIQERLKARASKIVTKSDGR